MVKSKKKAEKLETPKMEMVDFHNLATTYHGRIEEFNNFIKFHDLNEDFQLEMFRLIDKFINSEERVLKIACLGCKGGGKSSNMILIALMILLTYQGELMMFYISGKEQQSKSVFINEIKHLVRNAKNYQAELEDILEIAATSVENKVTEHSIKILTYSASSKGLTVAGIHCSGIHLFILDEAPSLPEEVYNHIKGTAASGKSIYLCGGNPDDDKVNFFMEVMQDKDDEASKGWHRFYISYLDLKRPDEMQRKAMLENYPEGTSAHTKYVLGRYPDKDENVLIDYQLLMKFIYKPEVAVHHNVTTSIIHLDRGLHIDLNNRYIPYTYIGVDLSEGVGKGYTCVTARTGHIIEPILYSNIINAKELAEFLNYIYYTYGRRREANVPYQQLSFLIDGDGTGRSFSNLVYHLGYQECSQKMVNIHNRVITDGGDGIYVDVRSSLYAKFRFWLELAEVDYSVKSYMDPSIKTLDYTILIRPSLYEKMYKKIIREARQTKIEIKDYGKLQLISKSLLTSSPDILDSICYTFAYENYSKLI